jgi:hypothetical protein
MDRHQFNGFSEPKKNYFPLPNDFFISTRNVLPGNQVAAPLKILLYFFYYHWHHEKLTQAEIGKGVVSGRKRLDKGTRLDTRTLGKNLAVLVELGVLEKTKDEFETHYSLRFSSDEDYENEYGQFLGFNTISENYFKVPNQLVAQFLSLKKASTILTVLYLIRHCWGYHNDAGVWLTANEIAYGRMRENGSTYDDGIGFEVRSVYRALQDAVAAGLLVFTDESPFIDGHKRRYNLRFFSMSAEVDPSGRYLGKLPWDEGRPCDEFAIPNDKFVNPSDEIADKFADPSDEFAKPNDKFADEFASGTPSFLSNFKKHLHTLSLDTSANRRLSFADVVGMDVKGFLSYIGLNEPACSVICKKYGADFIAAWILKAFGSSEIKNPIGFFVWQFSQNEIGLPDPVFIQLARARLSEWPRLDSAWEEDIQWPGRGKDFRKKVGIVNQLPEFIRELLSHIRKHIAVDGDENIVDQDRLENIDQQQGEIDGGEEEILLSSFFQEFVDYIEMQEGKTKISSWTDGLKLSSIDQTEGKFFFVCMNKFVEQHAKPIVDRYLPEFLESKYLPKIIDIEYEVHTFF